MSDPTPDNRTDAWLAGLAQQFALGRETTLEALAGQSADAPIVIATCAAAALLARHADHATPDVTGLLKALATPTGQEALTAAWDFDSALTGLEPDLDMAERLDILRDAVETAALFEHAPSEVQGSIQDRMDTLEDTLAVEPEAHRDLHDSIVLFGNVANLRDPAHPLAAFLAFAREMTSPFAAPVDAAHASALAREALAPLVAAATIAKAPSLPAQWCRTFLAWLEKVGGRVDDMLAIARRVDNVAWAATTDVANEARVTLVSGPDDEVNAVFSGPDVLLEWQGVEGRVPTRLRVEAATDLEPTETMTTIDGDRRLRWKLRVPPGESGTVLTLVFDDGTEQRLVMPGHG